MNLLPGHSQLNIGAFSKAFENTTNSYKFYWFQAILDHLAENEDPFIDFREISLSMLSSVWYPLDYYKLSFGKDDSFKILADSISRNMTIDNSILAGSLKLQLKQTLPEKVYKDLIGVTTKTLKRYVVTRFIRPFYPELQGISDQEVNAKIKALANSGNSQNIPPYSFSETGIVLNKQWATYFNEHQVILRGFINWNLLRFLQKNNPTVVGLSEKLVKPYQRNLKGAKDYWRTFLKENSVNCIYSNQLLKFDKVSLDHFIPWSYVANDLVWNIIPTSVSINSSKSNTLPSLDSYLDSFCNLQYKAFHFHLESGNHKIIEDYSSIFSAQDYASIDQTSFTARLSQEIINNNRIATNLGFSTPYIFKEN